MLKRDLTDEIIDSAKYFPVIAILGPRQSGKSTLAQKVFKSHTYKSLEDLDLRAAAADDPRTFLLTHGNEHGMIIDEFQYVPDLLSYIQTIVDKEQKSGYFVLTGSQNFLINEAITQSLAGRVAIHTLLPLSISELSKNDLLPAEMETILYNGCYPAIYAKGTVPKKLYKNYIRTYIERDVRQLTQVGDLILFQNFMIACALRVGQLINMASLAGSCGISEPTAKRWLAILEACYLIFLVYPYHNKTTKRLIKSPKLYFYDTGLVCNLLKINARDLALHPERGHLFESFIVSEIMKWYYNHDETPNIYFWRDSNDHEVDCIIEEGMKVIPLEIKSSRTTSSSFFTDLNYWSRLHDKKLEDNYVIYAGSIKQPKINANIISWQELDDFLTAQLMR